MHWALSCIVGLHQCHVLRYALHVPDNLPLDAAAPLLCAGITVYSPMMHYGLNKPGMKLGVVGLGGLGHMAVKLGKVCAMTRKASCTLSRTIAKSCCWLPDSELLCGLGCTV